MNQILENLVESNGFWTVIGILIGSLSNLLIYAIQKRIDKKIKIEENRNQKLEEIADFFSLIDERIKAAHSKTILEGISFWSKNSDFWASVKTFKIRIIITIYFKRCLNKFDDYQISINNFAGYLTQTMQEGKYSPEIFRELINQIELSRNNFFVLLAKEYIPT